MTVCDQIATYRNVVPRMRKADKLDLLTWLRHRPQLLAGTFDYETALLTSGKIVPRLKALAELKSRCPNQLRVLPRHRFDIGASGWGQRHPTL
jgi:hypothetical protein